MITVLEYLVIAAAIGLVVFFLASWVFGRGEQLAPLPARTSPAELPDTAPAGDDIRKVRFAVGVRGYRMGDVDWTLDRMADELDRLRERVRELGGDPDLAPPERELLPDDLTPEFGPPPADQPVADRTFPGTPAFVPSADDSASGSPADDPATGTAADEAGTGPSADAARADPPAAGRTADDRTADDRTADGPIRLTKPQ